MLLFAILKNNNSKFLLPFRKRGFYIDTGLGSVITQEDIDELLRRAKEALAEKNDLEFGLDSEHDKLGKDQTENTEEGKAGDTKRESVKDETNGGPGTRTGTGTTTTGGKTRHVRGRGRIPIKFLNGGIDIHNNNTSSDENDDDDEYDEDYMGFYKRKQKGKNTDEKPPWKP